MAQSFSGREFAVLDGSSPAAVRKARHAGHIVVDALGRYDPKDRRNAAWLKREKQTERRAAKLPEARLQAASARLATLEFEVEVRREFYVPRDLLALRLHRIADALLLALQAFPEPWAVPLLWEVEAEREAFAAALREAMARHLEDMGDLHTAIERALDEAGTSWRGHRPEPRKGVAIPAWIPPTTIAQAERRRAAAATTLETIKLEVRRGLRLAEWPARKAGNGLIIGWRQQCMEWFAVRQGVGVLVQMGRRVDHTAQWTLHQALQRVMRVMLRGVDQAVADGGSAEQAAVRRRIGTSPL
jgi:hypothetical protein